MESTSSPVSDSYRAEKQILKQRVSKGGLWFLLMAGSAIANLISLWRGGGFPFDLDLGFTQFVAQFAESFRFSVRDSLLGVHGVVALVFLFLWHQAMSRRKEAFLAGMIIYAVDGVLLILVPDFFLIAVHGAALFMLYRGWRAVEQLSSWKEPHLTPG
jgi:hypothetical protein